MSLKAIYEYGNHMYIVGTMSWVKAYSKCIAFEHFKLDIIEKGLWYMYVIFCILPEIMLQYEISKYLAIPLLLMKVNQFMYIFFLCYIKKQYENTEQK